jgi:hypothetical protein
MSQQPPTSLQRQKVMYATDCESDDFAAILSQLKSDSLSGIEYDILVVVGCGNHEKVTMFANFVNSLPFKPFWKSLKIVQGPLSNSNYPSEALTSFGQTPINLLSLPNTFFPSGSNILSDEGLAHVISSFVNQDQDPVTCIMLMPIPQMMLLDDDTLKKINIYCYGSFNFRKMVEMSSSNAVLNLFNKKFKFCLIFETFIAMGPDNTLDPITAPNYFNTLTSSHLPIHIGLLKLIDAWNRPTLSRCLGKLSKIHPIRNHDPSISRMEMYSTWSEDLNQVSKKLSEIKENGTSMNQTDLADLERPLKIAKNIVKAQGLQMVFADIGLITFLLNPKFHSSVVKGQLSFDERGYTVIEENPQGSIAFVKGIDAKELMSCCI